MVLMAGYRDINVRRRLTHIYIPNCISEYVGTRARMASKRYYN